MKRKRLTAEEREEERNFLRQCIELFRSMPALWKIKSEEYMDREKKAEAYHKLLVFYQERYPNAKIEDVKNKFNSLRTNFRKEIRKFNDLKKSGAGREDVYVPTCWYFDDMKFLIDQETPSDSINIMEDEGADEKVSQDISNGKVETPATPHLIIVSPAGTPQNEAESPRKLICSTKKHPTRKNNSRPHHDEIGDSVQNECTKFGELIAIKLQKFGDEERSFLMHRINNLIYEAEAEVYTQQQHYNSHSALSNPSPSVHLSPVPTSILKTELIDLSPSNLNS